MKLYDYTRAPNPRRVRIFMAEKGIEIPLETVDLGTNAQFDEGFTRRNPFRTVPVLELDDGTHISESMAICRYLEALYPEPPLFGGTALEQALVEMWSRRAELTGLLHAAEVVRNSIPFFADKALPGVEGGSPQIEALIERGKAGLERFFRAFDKQLANSEFVAGGHYSVADITTQVTIEFAGWRKIGIPEECKNLASWYQQVSARPSAKA